jgi:hypothetical protein
MYIIVAHYIYTNSRPLYAALSHMSFGILFLNKPSLTLISITVKRVGRISRINRKIKNTLKDLSNVV